MGVEIGTEISPTYHSAYQRTEHAHFQGNAVNAGNSEGKSVVADYMESNSVRKHWLGAVKGAQRKSML